MKRQPKPKLQPVGQQVAEITLRYTNRRPLDEMPFALSAESAAEIIYPHFADTVELHESFIVLLLNQCGRVKGIYRTSTGGLTGTVADTRLILAAALKSCSNQIILAHNHPSGNLTPSQADKTLTQKISEAARFMDIRVLDHLIFIPGGRYCSLAEEGLITW